MANTIKLRRSAVQGNTPTTAQLALGEVAINTYDGKLFIKKDDGAESIVEIGAGGAASVVTSDTAPSSPSDGDLWYDTTTAALYIYYADGTSNQWVTTFTGGAAEEGSGAVSSVNTQTGAVVLDADDIDDTSTLHKFATAAQLSAADSALQPGDIGVTVQGYNANTVIDANYVATDQNFTNADHTKLDGIAAGAEVNVQSDWNAVSGDAQILNKPTIPTNNNQLTNGAGYITDAGVTQIVAGTNVTISPVGGTGAVTINASGGGGSAAYFSKAFSGSQNVPSGIGTFADLGFNQTPVTSGTGDFTHSGGSITIVQAGVYNVSYSAFGEQTSGSNRKEIQGRIELNGAEVTGTRTTGYSRNSTQAGASVAGSAILSLSASDVLTIGVSGDSTVVFAITQGIINIQKIS